MTKEHRKYIFLIYQNFNSARYNQKKVGFQDVFVNFSVIQKFPEIRWIFSDIQAKSGWSLVSKWPLHSQILMSSMIRIQIGSNKPLHFTLRLRKDKNVGLALQVVISKKGMTRWRQKWGASEDITVFDRHHVQSAWNQHFPILHCLTHPLINHGPIWIIHFCNCFSNG